MRRLDRREFLTTTGASVASIAVAGCLGGNGGNGNGDGGTGDNGSTAGNESNESTGNETDDQSVDIDEWDLTGEVGETPEYLEITSFNPYETADNVGVIGVAENVGDNPLDDIEIEVSLNDGDTVIGEFIDTSTEDIDYLPPGDSWRFDVVFDDENLSDATNFTVSAEAEVVEEADTGMNETA
ncbi:FxLYD domain-containing protein [Halalkalicoccus salilacus]|uniref:FxLYD domain-containing protein n=1 Tax=Halalkalicoccus salilacus TaxID=3117459 RepID=UPI00300F5F7C